MQVSNEIFANMFNMSQNATTWSCSRIP